MPEDRVAIEVDGDNVTLVEMEGDVALAARPAINAGTLRDSLNVALSGYRQRRSDPHLSVSFVSPGLVFQRLDVTSDMFDDPSSAVSPMESSGLSCALSLPPERPEEGYVSSGYVLGVPSEYLEELEEALGGLRYIVRPAAGCVPQEGVWLGIHMASCTLTIARSGHVKHVAELASGGLGSIAPMVDPDDPLRGLSLVASALSGSDTSPVVNAELGRFYRRLARALRDELSSCSESAAAVSVFGVGGRDRLLAPALEELGLRVETPDSVARALSHLPVPLRMPALSALCAAAEPMRPPAFSSPSSPMPEIRVRRSGSMRRAALLAASACAFSLSSYHLLSVLEEGDNLRSELSSLPPSVYRASELVQEASSRAEVRPDVLAAAASLPGRRIRGMEVVGVVWAGEGEVEMVLEGPEGSLSDTEAVLSEITSSWPVLTARLLSAAGDGRRTSITVRARLEVLE